MIESQNKWMTVCQRKRTTFQLPNRSILERFSSGSRAKGDTSSFKLIRDLRNDRNGYNREAKKRMSALKLGSSFDTTCWIARRDIAEQGPSSHTILTRKM